MANLGFLPTWAVVLHLAIDLFLIGRVLLHAKTLTVDDEITLIGSTNLDRRSFDLNYKNNLLLHSRQATAAVVARQERFLSASRAVDIGSARAVSQPRRAWRNALAMLGPVL